MIGDRHCASESQTARVGLGAPGITPRVTCRLWPGLKQLI